MHQNVSSLLKQLILVVETQDFGSMLIFENHNDLKYMIKKFGTLFASQIHQNVSKQVKLVEMDNFCCSVPSFVSMLNFESYDYVYNETQKFQGLPTR